MKEIDCEAKWESTRDLINYVKMLVNCSEKNDYEVSEEQREKDRKRLIELYNQVWGIVASEVDYDTIISEVQNIRANYQNIEKFKKEVLKIENKNLL